MTQVEMPFSGTRIVEFATVAAGPLVSTYLSFFGAEAIHVEAKRRPDTCRYFPPAIKGKPGWGYIFASINTNKYGITLDITRPEGSALAKRIVAEWADVVIENFTPGVLKRNGLGYEDFRKVRPEVIMLSTCNLGQTGPYATHPGMGSHLSHLAGFGHLTGWPDRSPVMLYGPYIDYISVSFATCSLLAALDYRRHTGKANISILRNWKRGSSSWFRCCWTMGSMAGKWEGMGTGIIMPLPTVLTRAVEKTGGASSPCSRMKNGRAFAASWENLNG